MESITEYVASLTFLSPFGLEPVSDNFHYVYADAEQLIKRMSNNATHSKMHQKRTAEPSWHPDFYHK